MLADDVALYVVQPRRRASFFLDATFSKGYDVFLPQLGLVWLKTIRQFDNSTIPQPFIQFQAHAWFEIGSSAPTTFETYKRKSLEKAG